MDLLHPSAFEMPHRRAAAGAVPAATWTDVGPEVTSTSSASVDSNGTSGDDSGRGWSRSPYSSRPTSFHPSPAGGYTDGAGAAGYVCKTESVDGSCPQVDSHVNFDARLTPGGNDATRGRITGVPHSGSPESAPATQSLGRTTNSHRADPSALAHAFGRLPFDGSAMDPTSLVDAERASQRGKGGETDPVPNEEYNRRRSAAGGWPASSLSGPPTPGDGRPTSRRQSQHAAPGAGTALEGNDYLRTPQDGSTSVSNPSFTSSREQSAEGLSPSSAGTAAGAVQPSAMAMYSSSHLYQGPPSTIPPRQAYASPGISPPAGSYVDLPHPAAGLPPIPRVGPHGFASGLTSADDLSMRRDSGGSDHLPSRPGSAFSSTEAASYQQGPSVWSSLPASRHSSLASSPASHYADLMPRNVLGYGQQDPRASAALTAGTERQQIEALLAPYIRQYVSSPNKFLLGERTILVMSGKVAQKSYGTEKRFLCPPPAALLLGCSWWSATPSEAEPIQLEAPTTVISMISERGPPNEAYSEWMTMSGRVASSRASLGDAPVAGRCVGKQLHISEVDEKTKRVKSVVRVFAPGYGSPDTRIIGSFPSKAIKVISKPSKKRQSIKNVELCIHHGTTVSLFNRLRSQTVSTKYLCISGPPASFPAGEWKAMTGQDNRPFAQGEDSTCFVARTSAWDPFIIYVVDPTKGATTPQAAPQPGYPRPPANALPLPARGGPLPVFYNQPIVLQCLSTGVVSPIMVIRKVEKGALAYGGLSSDNYAPTANRHPVAPGESIGDMVSSLHKIALEVLSDPHEAYSTPATSALQGFPGSGSFLACLGENVGVNAAQNGRTMTPEFEATAAGRSATANAVAENDYLASPSTSSKFLPSSRRSADRPSPEEADFTSDGGKVRRSGRRGPSMSETTLTSGRSRRNASLPYGGDDSTGSEAGDEPTPASWGAAQSRAWQVECGEPAVWTIVGCEIERHNFYIPPVLIGGYNTSGVAPGTVSEVFTTPNPRSPIGLGTNSPIPQLHRYLASGISDRRDQRAGEWITFCGADLSPHMWVWFGEHPSPAVEFKSTECIVAQVPHQLYGQATPNQILLVRSDGVIFGSQLFFPSI